jgi:hypothetical protein
MRSHTTSTNPSNEANDSADPVVLSFTMFTLMSGRSRSLLTTATRLFWEATISREDRKSTSRQGYFNRRDSRRLRLPSVAAEVSDCIGEGAKEGRRKEGRKVRSSSSPD